MKIKDHFSLRNFSLGHSDKTEFTSSKCKSRTLYLIWRICWAVYHSSWLLANLVAVSLRDDLNVAKWFVYLSNWVYLILTTECVLEAVVVIGNWNRKSEVTQGVRLPWYFQLMWLLYTLSVVGTVMISIWYWSLLHKGRELTAIRFNTHAISLIYIILNMAITRFPLRLLHFLYPVTLGVVFTIFSAIYYVLGGTNQNGNSYIYSILDWSKVNRTLAISSLSNFIFIPVVHVMMWALNLSFQKVYESSRHRRVVYSQALDGLESGEIDTV